MLSIALGAFIIFGLVLLILLVLCDGDNAPER
jgi:hypothetical protein